MRWIILSMVTDSAQELSRKGNWDTLQIWPDSSLSPTEDCLSIQSQGKRVRCQALAIPKSGKVHPTRTPWTFKTPEWKPRSESAL